MLCIIGINFWGKLRALTPVPLVGESSYSPSLGAKIPGGTEWGQVSLSVPKWLHQRWWNDSRCPSAQVKQNFDPYILNQHHFWTLQTILYYPEWPIGGRVQYKVFSSSLCKSYDTEMSFCENEKKPQTPHKTAERPPLPKYYPNTN